MLTSIVGLTTANGLVRFDSASPDTLVSIGAITGIVSGDSIVGIDFRPATGGLYGLGLNGTTARLYLINATTAAATQIGGNLTLPVSVGTTGAETAFGFDFNPVADRIRVVANNRDNFRLNPITGAIAGADVALNPGSPVVVGAAYTNNFAGAISTTLYDIDLTSNGLFIQGGNPVPPGQSPNGGVLTFVGNLGANAGPEFGFDIAQGSGTAFAAMQVGGGVSGLYTIDLSNGAASFVGNFAGGLAMRDISVAQATQVVVAGFPSPTSPGTPGNFSVTAVDPYGLTVPGYSGTVKFSSSDPSALLPVDSKLANGVGTFSASLNTFGIQSITATDTLIATLTGTQSNILVPSSNIIVTGADAGGGPDVRVFDAVTHQPVFGFFAYDPLFTGGVRVAVGDVNGDGFPDIVTAAGPGGGPDVAVFSGKTATRLFNFFAFDPLFTGGVLVGAGDINADGFADIICGADVGGGPNVTVFSGKDNAQTRLTSFFAYDPSFTGGVRVAGGDVNNDGFDDIICGAGPGGGPNITVFSGKDNAKTRLFSIFAYDPNFTAGIYVAGGDINGDGHADMLAGAGRFGGPNVTTFSGTNAAQLSSFFAFDPTFIGGIRIAAAQQPSGIAHLVAVEGGQTDPLAGPLSSPEVRVFDALSGQLLDAFFAVDRGFTGGLYVAA